MNSKFYETKKQQERVVTVGVSTPRCPTAQTHLYLEELTSLITTAGGKVFRSFTQNRSAFDSRTLIGKGKIEEIGQYIEEHEIQTVIFDDELSPSQQRNLEKILHCKIMDRSGIILEIFAKNAQTAEAKISVEIAQLQYYMPRLTRLWTHFSRQVGGFGTKGPGETQLEIDRRLMRDRISELKKKLIKNQKSKKLQQSKRQSAFHVVLVGYTNTGKSSLINLLTHADVLVENKLFATLDTTTRKFVFNPEQQALISDTVGFIRKLPHHLIESFKSTLSVIEEADLILHLSDANDPEFEYHQKVTEKVLKNLNTKGIPRIPIFNKIDLLSEEQNQQIKQDYPNCLFISVAQKKGIPPLHKTILKHLEEHQIVSQKEKIKSHKKSPWN